MVEVDWSSPDESVWDHFFIQYRPSLQNPDAPWVQNSTYSTNLTLTDLFPGERYEIEVYTVNKDVRSDVQRIYVVIGRHPLLLKPYSFGAIFKVT